MSVPSAFDANASADAASNPAPSTPAADRDRRDDLAGLVVRDRHHAAAASAEQPVVRRRRSPSRPAACTARWTIDASRSRALASISTTSLVSVRFAYTLPSPADTPYSGLPPSGMFVISVPCLRIDHGGRVCVAVEREDAVRRGVVDDRVGVFGRRDPAERLERLQIEHDDRRVVARGREAVAGLLARSRFRARRECR